MKPIHVLLIEDNDGDILLTKEAFESFRVLVTLSVIKDGEKAIDFLGAKERLTNADLPDLLLLDINLPKKNGFEVLQFIKGNEDLKHIPVIMLTTSSSEQDIKLCYINHANCFITKPVDLDIFLDAISKIEGFWLTIVKLPVNTVAYDKRQE